MVSELLRSKAIRCLCYGIAYTKRTLLTGEKTLTRTQSNSHCDVREETRKVDAAGLIRVDNEFYRLPNDLINKEWNRVAEQEF